MARSAGSARPGSAPSLLLVPLLLVAMAGAGSAADISANTMSPVWPDDRFHRLAALALLEQLRGALLTEDSATLTLENWCTLHHLAPTPRVLAERDPGMDRPLDPTDRLRLDVGPVEPIRYRHVRLVCGPHLLSEADNWYVPGRLLPGMDRQLETTDTPFGKVVHPLGFTRTTLSSRLLWDPLPPDWSTRHGPAPSGRTLAIPNALIENKALLRRQDGEPFSLVVETYRSGLLAFAPPAP